MSTPTKQDDRHEYIEVKPDYESDPEEPKDPWWYWFRIELPDKPQEKLRFFGVILMILAGEIGFGFTFGMILRSIFGWPF